MYKFAFFNFAMPNGPASMMMFSRPCKFLMMGYGLSGSEVHTREAFQRMGMQFGDQYKFFGEGQVISYLPDSYENIKREFCLIEDTLN
jgi:hypothetical protein